MPINAESFLKDFLSGPTAKGALGGLAGGMLGGMLTNKKMRKSLGKNAVKVGGAAAVAGLAWYAWRNWQAKQQGSAVPPPPPPSMDSEGDALFQAPPRDGSFLPPASQPAACDALALAMVTAMIGAAKADGQIDGTELKTLLDTVEGSDLEPRAKADVLQRLNSTVTVDDVAALSTGPEMGAELYAASLGAIALDSPAEQAYLAMLARKLALPPGLVQELHAAAGAPAPLS